MSIALPVMGTVIVSVFAAAFTITRKIGSFTTLFREFRLHIHSEKQGQLEAEGILYPRTVNGDRN